MIGQVVVHPVAVSLDHPSQDPIQVRPGFPSIVSVPQNSGLAIRVKVRGTLDLGPSPHPLVESANHAEQIVLALRDGQAISYGPLALPEDVRHPEIITDNLYLFR